MRCFKIWCYFSTLYIMVGKMNDPTGSNPFVGRFDIAFMGPWARSLGGGGYKG